MMRRIYSILFYLFIPLILLQLLLKSFYRNPAYRQRIGERFGCFVMPEKFQHGIWVHAVSVGEAIAATPLVHALQELYPTMPIVITTMTPTGSDIVKKTFGDSVFHVYIPYDVPGAVQRFLTRVKPRLAIIMETEIWANLFFYAHKNNVPIILANARLSEKSIKGYSLIKNFVRDALDNVTMIATQSEIDAARFKSLGIEKDKVVITGNIKFDVAPLDQIQQAGKDLRQQLGVNRPVFIAASTHEGEESLILSAWQQIKASLPTALLILAPRHKERCHVVEKLCREKGCSVDLRTSGIITNQVDILLVNTLGELMLFYAAADIAFVGGSLVKRGGHNLLEPALFKLPVISGKHLFNFSKIAELFTRANALFIVNNQSELVNTVIYLFNNPDRCHEFGVRAEQVVAANRGALQEHLRLIARFM